MAASSHVAPSRPRAAIGLLSAVLAVCSPIEAQPLSTGNISGVVVDQQGRPIAAQRLELRGPVIERSLRLVATTDVNGEFVFRRLIPGTYAIDWIVNGEVVLSREMVELTPESMRVDRLVLVQPADETRPPSEPRVLHTQALTFNPLFGLNGFYNAEYERRLSSRTTWGFSVTGSRWEDNDYETVKALVRFYTRGAPFRGNFIGVRVGGSRATDPAGISDEYVVVGAEVGGTVGLLGERYELVASGGAGLNRLIGGDFSFKTFPAIRFNIGLAF